MRKQGRVKRISPEMDKMIQKFQRDLSLTYGRNVHYTEASELLARRIKKLDNGQTFSINWFD